jgi:hypothetical protein
MSWCHRRPGRSEIQIKRCPSRLQIPTFPLRDAVPITVFFASGEDRISSSPTKSWVRARTHAYAYTQTTHKHFHASTSLFDSLIFKSIFFLLWWPLRSLFLTRTFYYCETISKILFALYWSRFLKRYEYMLFNYKNLFSCR